MNQVRIIDLPGLNLPDWVKGKTGFQLLSSYALRQRVAAKAKELQLSANDPDLLPQFDHCLTAVSPQICTAAETIAVDYGRALAYLLLTLKRGDVINQQARPEWQAQHWAFWQQIKVVWLGGGLLSGHLGQSAVPIARDLIHASGLPEFQLHLAPNGRHLPLLGVARTAPVGTSAMLLFDFGQTAVKRAVAHYGADRLSQLSLLPSVPPPCEDVLHPSLEPAEIARFADWLVGLIVETWRETAVSYPGLSYHVAASMACYLLDGQPREEDVGCYGRLQHLAPNLTIFLTDQLSQRLGEPAVVQLWHDGTAAALCFAEEVDSAVLTCGTAIGVGFPSPKQNLLHLNNVMLRSAS